MKSFQASRAATVRFHDSLPVVIIRTILLLAGVGGLLVLLLNFFWAVSSGLVAVATFLLAPALFVYSLDLYLGYVRFHPEFLLPKVLANDPFNRTDFETQFVLMGWQQKDGLGGLLEALLFEPESKHILWRLGLSNAAFRALKSQPFNQEQVKELLAQQIQALAPGQLLSIYAFLEGVLLLPALQPILEASKIAPADLSLTIRYYNHRHRVRAETRAWWLHNQSRTGGFARAWSVSYTTLLDQFTSSLPPLIRERTLYLPIFERQKLVEQMIFELNKTASQNLLLVGEVGVGKKELFYHFGAQVLFYQTKTALDGKEVRLLDLQRLLAAAPTAGQLQQLFAAVMAEINRANNIILFIESIDLLLAPQEKAGAADLSNLLEGYLNDPRLHIIGSLSSQAYLKLVKPNQLLAERFSAVEIAPPTDEDLLPILLSHLNRYEGHYQVFFTIEALRQLVDLAKRYIKDQNSPLRELKLAEQVAAAVHAQGKILVGAEQVTSVVEQQAQVPIQMGAAEQTTLLNLESQLHQRVIGQDRAIKQVSDALLRARAGLTTGDRPIGTFLFLGPTGVGKTETAKALAASYFGSDQKLIRLDMTEYADGQALQKLLGSDQVTSPGSLTLAIQDQPSAVLLFDEFEKASEQVKNVLLQLLDEGRLTTNYGQVLDFTNTLVIATSNAGSAYIKEQISAGVKVEQFEKTLLDELQQQKIFLPELLNRFDGVIVFAPLTPAEILQVVGLQLELLKRQLKKEKGITLSVAPPVMAELAKRGYDPVFGARALQRVIKNDLETAIAKQIIAASPQPGSTLVINSL